jgi:hypothetical protein
VAVAATGHVDGAQSGRFEALPAPSEARRRPGAGRSACASLAGETEKASGIASNPTRENSLPNDAVRFADSFDQFIPRLSDPTRR